MNKRTKKWFLAAAILVAVGIIIFIGALAVSRFDFAELSTGKFQTNTYEFEKDFENISVNVSLSSVTFAAADEDICRIECFENEKLKHSVKIQEGTLIIDEIDSRKWYDCININFQTPSVTIYLPKDSYTSLSVTTITGNIRIPDKFSFKTVKITGTTSNISCSASVSENTELDTTTGNITLGSAATEIIKLSATTGKITVNDVACNNLTIKSNTGHINLKNILAVGNIKAENTTGGVHFESCDAAGIAVKTTTGVVKGTLLSEKIFITDTSTGRISIPNTSNGGKCEITTTTGDIIIEIK